MKPLEFYMDEAAYKTYYKSLQRCADTTAHQFLNKRRWTFVIIMFVLTVALSLVEHANWQELLVAVVLGAIIYIPIGGWLLPHTQIKRAIQTIKKNDGSGEWFTQPHRVWSDGTYYYHQIGNRSASGIALSRLRFVRRVQGGVVLVLESGEDFLFSWVFGSQQAEKEFCDELRQLAQNPPAAAAQPSQLEREAGQPGGLDAGADTALTVPPEKADANPLELRFSLDREQLVELMDEANKLVADKKDRRKYLRNVLIVIVLTAIPWKLMGHPLWLLLVFFAILMGGGALFAYVPALVHWRNERRVQSGKLDFMLEEQEIQFTPEKVYVQRKGQRYTYHYDTVKKLLVGEKGLYLLFNTNVNVLILPKAALEGEDQLQYLIDEVSRFLEAAKTPPVQQ